MSRQDWLAEGERCGWRPPPASAGWKRLPLVRHLRFVKHSFLAALWYSSGPGAIGIPTGYDGWGLEGMRRGFW